MVTWDNTLLKACARYPNMRVFNWAALAKTKWYVSDGILFTSAGYAARGSSPRPWPGGSRRPGRAPGASSANSRSGDYPFHQAHPRAGAERTAVPSGGSMPGGRSLAPDPGPGTGAQHAPEQPQIQGPDADPGVGRPHTWSEPALTQEPALTGTSASSAESAGSGVPARR